MSRFEPTSLSRVRRHPERASYDEAAVFAILDAAVLGHVGYVIDGRPVVTPTAYWRHGRNLYWHGAAASRMLKLLADGRPACVTVSLLDGLVLAPSGFAHSVNYRSVIAFGHARLIEDLEAKREATNAFVDRLYPDRAKTLRQATERELLQISLIEMTIEEASAKVRSGGVKQLDEDIGWPAWAGVIDIETRIAAASPDAVVGGVAQGQAAKAPYPLGSRLDALLTEAANAQIEAAMA